MQTLKATIIEFSNSKMKDKEEIKLIVGTRGSALALAQTDYIVKLLQKKNRHIAFETRVIKTSGDDLYRKHNSKLTGKDSFTREIDLSLVRGEIDFAVHSLKDVPITFSSVSKDNRLEIAAFPKRESPYDVLISKDGGITLGTLPDGATVGTSSLRRAIQLKVFRHDFEIVEIHGNVPTRIKKMHEGALNLDAIVLAEAGLNRLGISEQIAEVIPSKIMLPAVGQGCLAVSVRSNDSRTREIVKIIDDKRTRLCVTAERAFSKELGGGCNTPIGALATMNESKIKLRGLIAGERSSKVSGINFVIRDEIIGKAEEAEKLGWKLAKTLREKSL